MKNKITADKHGVKHIAAAVKQEDEDKWSPLHSSRPTFQTLVTQDKDMGTHLPLYQNKCGGPNSSMSQAWQLCGFRTSTPSLCLIVLFAPSPLPCFLLITLVSPRAVSPLSQSAAVTHSIIPDRFIRHQPIYSARRWRRHVGCSTQWLLYSRCCLPVCRRPSTHSAKHKEDKDLPFTEVPLFAYILCKVENLWMICYCWCKVVLQ